ERVYQMLGEATEEEETRKLVEKVLRLAERFGGRITADQLRRSNKSRYRSIDQANQDLESLAALGLGRWGASPPGATGGRPARTFVPQTPIPEPTKTSRDTERMGPPSARVMGGGSSPETSTKTESNIDRAISGGDTTSLAVDLYATNANESEPVLGVSG